MAGRLVDYMGSGLASALPTAATVDGDLTTGAAGFYYATDTQVLYCLDRSGTPSWDSMTSGGGAGGPTLTPPNVADFTWVNQGAATAVDNDEGIFYTSDIDGEQHILDKAAPATPFDVYALFDPLWGDATPSGTGLVNAGCIIARDSAGGDFVAFETSQQYATSAYLHRLRIQRWTNPTTAAAAPLTYYMPNYSPWIRINVTSTTVTFYARISGQWVQIGTETIATFVGTVDRVGVGFYTNAGVDFAYTTLKNFSFTDPFA